MRHRDKKIKFSAGKDANKMLVRKLLVNFFSNGKIVTTEKKGKVIKSLIDKMVGKMIQETESNKNYLLRFLNNLELVNILFKETGPILKDKPSGGYVRLVKMLQRDSDGAEIVKLEWVYPVIINKKKETAIKKEKLKVDNKK